MNVFDALTRKIAETIVRLTQRKSKIPLPLPPIPRGNPPWDPEGKSPPTVGIDREPDNGRLVDSTEYKEQKPGKAGKEGNMK